ncbi:MAG TPA: carboxypeptidase-like regulatory domain-containing protein, partial [Pyrinomonadaceae bacterium]
MLHLTRRWGGFAPGLCRPRRKSYAVPVALAALMLLCSSPLPFSAPSVARAQDTLTGAFQGTVTNSVTGESVAGAAVEIINRETGQVIPKTTDTRGRFYQGLLSPGLYTIRVSAAGFVTQEVVQRLFISRAGEVVPVPVALEPAP